MKYILKEVLDENEFKEVSKILNPTLSKRAKDRLFKNLQNVFYTTKKGYLTALKKYEENFTRHKSEILTFKTVLKLSIWFTRKEIENLFSIVLDSVRIGYNDLLKISFKSKDRLKAIINLDLLDRVYLILNYYNSAREMIVKKNLLDAFIISEKLKDII